MSKSIIKEIIIALLLCLGIIIILGLLLYEYVPMAKVIPEPVSYVTPEDVKEELIETGDIDESQVIMTYEIDSTDLNNYERIKNYNPGKANPFSSYVTEDNNSTSSNNTTTNGTVNNANGSSQANNSNDKTNSNDSNTSGGQFFQNKGTK